MHYISCSLCAIYLLYNDNLNRNKEFKLINTMGVHDQHQFARQCVFFIIYFYTWFVSIFSCSRVCDNLSLFSQKFAPNSWPNQYFSIISLSSFYYSFGTTTDENFGLMQQCAFRNTIGTASQITIDLLLLSIESILQDSQ